MLTGSSHGSQAISKSVSAMLPASAGSQQPGSALEIKIFTPPRFSE